MSPMTRYISLTMHSKPYLPPSDHVRFHLITHPYVEFVLPSNRFEFEQDEHNHTRSVPGFFFPEPLKARLTVYLSTRAEADRPLIALVELGLQTIVDGWEGVYGKTVEQVLVACFVAEALDVKRTEWLFKRRNELDVTPEHTTFVRECLALSDVEKQSALASSGS